MELHISIIRKGNVCKFHINSDCVRGCVAFLRCKKLVACSNIV